MTVTVLLPEVVAKGLAPKVVRIVGDQEPAPHPVPVVYTSRPEGNSYWITTEEPPPVAVDEALLVATTV